MSKSDLDFYLRQALSRWQAKNNLLIEKWKKCLENLHGDDFFHCSELIVEFLDDLETPCDSFISDFDMRNCK